MFFRRKKVINFREPIHVENPLISFEYNKVVIVTDCGHKLVVETKPAKRRKQHEDEDNG